MKKVLLILLSCFIFISCETINSPVCRHFAVFHAITYSDLHQVRVRIGVGYTATGVERGIAHSQAEAFIDGTWKPIGYVFGSIIPVPKDPYFVFQYYTVEEFMDKFLK